MAAAIRVPARIVLRCLAKQAGDRFRSYDELRRALLPFQSTSPTPATLARRFLAGMIDYYAFNVIYALPTLLGAADTLSAGATVLLLEFAYFGVLEGVWGASLGKALRGLRVGGLDRNAPGIPRAALRALICMLPALFLVALRFRNGLEAPLLTAWNIGAGILVMAYPAFLALSAWRGNGFATVTDLLTKTRVFEKSAYEPREGLTQIEEPVAGADALPRIGPYHALATLATDAEGELVLGYDTKLLRRVWIRKAPAGAPPVPAALRNAARPGRLRWLQGYRDGVEAWDAYEAVSGAPQVSLLRAPPPWRNVRHWLLDLATELDVVSSSGASPGAFSLERVWITADGRAKLLDFPAPGADRGAEPITERAVFLNQLAISALEGRIVSADEARAREAHAPAPIPARGILRDLRLTQDLGALAARLRPLAGLVPEVSRRRRFGLIAGCAIPALAGGISMFVGTRMIQKWERQYPEVIPLRNALTMSDRMSHGIYPPHVDPKIGAGPVEIYIAGRFGKFIRDPKAWSSLPTTITILPPMRAEAMRIAAAHPNPTDAEIESARAALGPALDSQGNMSSPAETLSEAIHDAARGNLSHAPALKTKDLLPAEMIWTSVIGICLWSAFFSVTAGGIFRGGLLLRALGIAVVRRDGTDASRGRMLWRACIGWSWLPFGGITLSILKPMTSETAATAIVGLLVLGAIVWSAARPGRSFQDRLAGTWLVPR